MKQVVILAGGKGTRLRERLGNRPKPLIDVCGTPLLERQIVLAKRHGFDRALVLVNYRAEQIAEFCAEKSNWGLDIRCLDDGQPRGTAGAVLHVFEELEDEFLVMYGDTMLEVDLNRFHRFHAAMGDAAATLFLHPNDHPRDSDLVELDERGHVVGFHPYPHDSARYYPNLVNAALYWVRKASLRPWRGHNGPMDFGKDLFPAMIDQGMTLRGYNSPEYIKDCGTPERIDRVCADFESGRIHRSSLGNPQAAVFLDRDGTLNREVSHLNSPEQLELLPGVAKAVQCLNRSEYRVCVVTNQPVIARGECTTRALQHIHNKLETLLGAEGAFVDRIYHCPHHPDSGFEGEVAELKIDCTCRKPGTGMIDTARADLNVDIGRSWLVGDATSDILAAKRAGLRSILVETGYAGLDQKHSVIPDHVAPDLVAAVDYILRAYPALRTRLANFVDGVHPGDLVFVGGQSRSGKSTFASALRDTLEASGRRCHVLCTDRWLLSEDVRAPGVLGRHDLAAMAALVRSLRSDRRESGEPFAVPTYDKMNKRQLQHADTVDFKAGDVVVIEGVMALHLAELAGARHRFFVEMDEEERRRRVIREYAMRGCDEADAIRIYEERLSEEAPLIAGSAASATVFDMAEITLNGEAQRDHQ